MVMAVLGICSQNQTKKENFQELFEKIDQEDDGVVYLRFEKLITLPNTDTNTNTNTNTIPMSEKSLYSGRLFSSYGPSTKTWTRTRR